MLFAVIILFILEKVLKEKEKKGGKVSVREKERKTEVARKREREPL